jgi:hypothetical protein
MTVRLVELCGLVAHHHYWSVRRLAVDRNHQRIGSLGDVRHVEVDLIEADGARRQADIVDDRLLTAHGNAVRACPWRIDKSCGDGGVVQPTTVLLPPISIEIYG